MQPRSFNTKGIDSEHTCTGCTFAWASCFRGAYTWDTCIGGICAKGTYIGAGTCSAYIRDACIGIVCVKGAYVDSASVIKRLEIHLQSFRILEVGGVRLKI